MYKRYRLAAPNHEITIAGSLIRWTPDDQLIVDRPSFPVCEILAVSPFVLLGVACVVVGAVNSLGAATGRMPLLSLLGAIWLVGALLSLFRRTPIRTVVDRRQRTVTVYSRALVGLRSRETFDLWDFSHLVADHGYDRFERDWKIFLVGEEHSVVLDRYLTQAVAEKAAEEVAEILQMPLAAGAA